MREDIVIGNASRRTGKSIGRTRVHRAGREIPASEIIEESLHDGIDAVPERTSYKGASSGSIPYDRTRDAYMEWGFQILETHIESLSSVGRIRHDGVLIASDDTAGIPLESL